jgi:hypothetical protein
MEEKMDDKIKDLHLLLMYLTGWEDEKRNSAGEKIFRAWRGYNFEILNALEEQKLIRQYRNANSRSLIVTEEGKQKAEGLKQRYLQ